MIKALYNYDIFPKVIPVGKESTITIKPLGGHAAFDPDFEYLIGVYTMSEGDHKCYPTRNNYSEYMIKSSADGYIRVTHLFDRECEYHVRITKNDKRVVELSVYAILPDLVGRYPYMGDFHMHSTMSDGSEHPYIVAANYRKFGYDFIPFTDHERYYPSLMARTFYKELDLDMKIYTGEEVHLPDNDIHIVNFGGDYSVNGMLTSSKQYKEKGDDRAWRSANGECPDIITPDEYKAQVNALAETLDIPEGVEKFVYAACVWVARHIKRANGLAIFAHPYWLCPVYHVPENITDLILERGEFDAFEIFGGEMYFEQNGFQAAKYYEMREKGIKVPIVGSTDSHGSTPHNTGYKTARTIVFSKANTKKDIIEAIKDYYAVAVQDIGEHPEVIGDLRMMRYGWFLYVNYFPIHDELCFEEGRLMKEYACGNTEAGDDLRRISGRVQKLREKYFLFE